jgi:cysteine desulfurase
VNGSTSHRLHNVSNLCFPGVDAEALFLSLPDLALSNGLACSSASLEPSHVLRAMGLGDDEAFQSVRFSLSAFKTEEEIQTTARAVRLQCCQD